MMVDHRIFILEEEIGLMKRVQCIAVMTILLAILFFGATAQASHHQLPFMTIEEFLEEHPEQNDLLNTFNAKVALPAEKCTDPSKPIKIAFIYPGLQVSDYWRRSIKSFRKRMEEKGIPFSIEEYHSKPATDQKLQEQHIQQALKNDPDYLVFTMDVFKHKTIIESLLKKQRPKLILQNITTPLTEWEGMQPFMYVGFDHAEGAKLIADYYKTKLGGEGAYGLLYFTKGYVSTMRGDTFRQYIQETSNIVMHDAKYTDGKLDRAFGIASAMLKDSDIDFLYACSTDIAIGAIQAINMQGKSGKVLINGWGGGGLELDAIRDGKLDVTVMRMNDDNGIAMAEAICLDATGKGDQVPTLYAGEMVLVEKGISPKNLNALIKRAFRYSGN